MVRVRVRAKVRVEVGVRVRVSQPADSSGNSSSSVSMYIPVRLADVLLVLYKTPRHYYYSTLPADARSDGERRGEDAARKGQRDAHYEEEEAPPG